MTVFVQDADFTLWHGDCLDVLRSLPDAAVHMCATSPPFYGLRDYGVDGQIGLEETPDAWLARLVGVFREVRRVLRDDGTLWVEIGDSYASASTGGAQGASGQRASRSFTGSSLGGGVPDGLKGKDLLGQPWMLAFALRADGWYLRSEIIWHRPNPMPESVTDRPTKAHSTVFLLSKRPRYFYDADAIRTEYAYDGRTVTHVEGRDGSAQHRNGERWQGISKTTQKARLETMSGGEDTYDMEVRHGGANARSVWRIPTEPTPFAHFATWPQKLVERMILAGTSEKGCCPECGAPWKRETEKSIENPGNRTTNGQIERTDLQRAFAVRRETRVETTGWQPTCVHDDDPVPATVLDPFGGSGTTAVVARRLGRASTLIELNADYCSLAAKRLSQQSLLAGDAA